MRINELEEQSTYRRRKGPYFFVNAMYANAIYEEGRGAVRLGSSLPPMRLWFVGVVLLLAAGLGQSVGGPEVKERFERQAEAERARARQEQGKRMRADST